MDKKEELLIFLNTNLFIPVLYNPHVSSELKYDFTMLFNAISKFSVEGILIYFWTTIINTELQFIFSHRLAAEISLDFDSFINQFKNYFTYEWLCS